MSQASPIGAESKQNASETLLGPQAPAFKPGQLLDVISGEFSADPAYSKITLRCIDGSSFECFADGVTLKGWSDKFLALAGHMILASRGEPLDLRPLSELHEEDEDVSPHPLAQPMPMQPPETVPSPSDPTMPIEVAGDPYDAQRDAIMAQKGTSADPGTLAAPPPFHTILPSGARLSDAARARFVDVVEQDKEASAHLLARTIDFVESFEGKPPAFFASAFVKATIERLLENVDRRHPKVIEIAKLAGIEP